MYISKLEIEREDKMNCEDCKYYEKINQYCGYCAVWDEQMKNKNTCEDVDESQGEREDN